MSDTAQAPMGAPQGANVDPTKLKLTLKEKMAYGIGDVGSNILLDIATLYLLKFYTDVLGIPGYYGGIIFLISKFFTAFTDIFTGIVLDSRKNIGKNGKFRPFILYFSFPVALLAIANFVGNDFSLNVKVVIATGVFMLFGLVFSLMNCSYGAMVPAITKNPNERASLAAWRQGGATLGLLLTTVLFVPLMNLIDGSKQTQYLVAVIIFMIVGVLCMILCYKGVQERYIVKKEATAEKTSFFASFKAITGNTPLFVLCVANFCTLAAFNIKLAIQLYYCEYVLKDPILLSYMGFFSMACIFLGVSLMPHLVERFGKKTVYIAGLSLWIGGDFLNYFIGGSPVVYVVLSCVTYFGTSFANSLNWALVSETVEYGEWKNGVRSEGTVYTGFTFFRKLSQGAAGFFPGFMLTQIGYVPNVEQSLDTQNGLSQLMFIYPGVLAMVACCALLFCYKLNEKMYVQIVRELEARRAQKEGNKQVADASAAAPAAAGAATGAAVAATTDAAATTADTGTEAAQDNAKKDDGTPS